MIEFIFGIINPIANGIFQEYVESANRATVTSIRSFLTSASVAFFAPILGLLADSQGLK